MGEVTEQYGELILEAALAGLLGKIIMTLLPPFLLSSWILSFYQRVIGGSL